MLSLSHILPAPRVLSVALLTLISASALAQEPVKYAPRGDFDLLIRQTASGPRVKPLPGQPAATYRLERFHQGWMRMDGMLDENGVKLNDKLAQQSGYMLVHSEKKLGFDISGAAPNEKATALPMDGKPDPAFVAKPTGETMTIVGEKCAVMAVEIAGSPVKTCVTPDGLTLRMEMAQGGRVILHEAVRLNWRSQNPADFTPPAKAEPWPFKTP